MKEILVILTGGTICTALQDDGTLAVSKEAGIRLLENFKRGDSPYAPRVRLTPTENLGILSENMTVDKWQKLLHTYLTHREKAYDGIIFAHGTDTLAYTAALFSMLLASTKVPVFFVSANARLDRPDSNGDINFRMAVECICRGIEPNVYALYQNISDRRVYLHLGSRLEQSGNYSEDFHSAGMQDITDASDENWDSYRKAVAKAYPQDQRNPVPKLEQLQLKPCVLLLQPYVGMDYGAYDYRRFQAVVHGTYHSGTASDEDRGVPELVRRCAEAGTAVYLSPARDIGEVYKTVRTLSRAGEGLHFLYGTTFEAAYAKVLIAYSFFDDAARRNAFLNTQINFEQSH